MKVNNITSEARRHDDMEMRIRLAAEAVEYSSALYSLTYGLEDLDPEVKIDKKKDPTLLVKDSVEYLRRARKQGPNAKAVAYTNLRTAADYLKTAFLNQVKKTSKGAG